MHAKKKVREVLQFRIVSKNFVIQKHIKQYIIIVVDNFSFSPN